MIDHVDECLKLWRRSAFVWGHSDCMMSIGDYVAMYGVTNVSDHFRGSYDDEAGALAMLAAQGGIAGLVALAGLRETAEPIRGDIVALVTDGAGVGAICTGQGYAGRLERGVIEVNRRFVTITHAWKIP